ncbi:hypothetical protein [Streptomyces sp. 147326]|uniref:hypothetical protein n=1 Tax=Streptomyces sp. 147326 TaxID=3074379 RepID=UPI0038573890
MISTQQIAGETAALDLMLAHLTHDAEAITSSTADSTACPTTQAYARQQLCGLLHDAVLARPKFSLNRPAVLGPAGRTWLQHVTMNGPVADTVIALADDGPTPATTSTTTSGSAAYAISAVAAERLTQLRDAGWLPDQVHAHHGLVKTPVSGPPARRGRRGAG